MNATAEQPTSRRTPRHLVRKPALTVKEIRFCKLYNEYQNATRAYREAGYPPHPPSSEWVMACRLLRRVQVREYIAKLRADAAAVATTTTAAVARSLAEQAFADRTAIFAADGTMLPPSEWPAELRAIIAGVEVEMVRGADGAERPKWKVRFERSTEAKRILAQWLGMIGPEQGASDGAANALADLVRDAIRGNLTAPVVESAREVVALPASPG